jgi:amidase
MVRSVSNHDEASPLVRMSAVELARAIRARTVSCAEVMATFLDHIGRFNPRVNALISLQDPEALMQQARVRDAQLARGEYLGRLHGLPHAVKDLAYTAGIRTTRGSPLLDSIPDRDSILVERIKAQGAVLIGKSNTAELGLGSQTYNPVFGTTLNAYHLGKTAGGSSGGAAVALALRMVPLADGSDMMGSLRNPAAYNNVFGFRPSHGCVPAAGDELYLDQLSVWGAMGRSVADVALLMSVIAGPDARAPLSGGADPGEFLQPLERSFEGVRIGWLGDLGGYLPFEPGVLELCEAACKVFGTLGCVVETAVLPCSPAALWEAWVTLRHWLIAGELEPLYREPVTRARLKPEARWEVESAADLSAADVYRASAAMRPRASCSSASSTCCCRARSCFPSTRACCGRAPSTASRWTPTTAGWRWWCRPASSAVRCSTCRSGSHPSSCRWACRSSAAVTRTSRCCSSAMPTIRRPAGSAAARRRCFQATEVALRATSTLPRMALEYGHTWWPAATIFSASACDTPWISTASSTVSPKPPPEASPMPTADLTVIDLGMIFICREANSQALPKQAA